MAERNLPFLFIAPVDPNAKDGAYHVFIPESYKEGQAMIVLNLIGTLCKDELKIISTKRALEQLKKNN